MNGDASSSQFGTLADTVLKLVQAGFLGFGALLFIMVFVILYRNQPTTPATDKLRQYFLFLGVGSYLFAGMAQLLPFIWPHAPYKLSIAFSPSLSAANLPEPTMTVLPANTQVNPLEPILIQRDSTLDVSIDGIINQARALTATATQLANANVELAKITQSDKSSAQPSASSAAQITSLSHQVQQSLIVHDFAKAALAAHQVNDATQRSSKGGSPGA